MSNMHDGLPSFQVLTEQQAKMVNNPVDPISWEVAWACNHCDRIFGHWESQDSIRNHLKDQYVPLCDSFMNSL